MHVDRFLRIAAPLAGEAGYLEQQGDAQHEEMAEQAIAQMTDVLCRRCAAQWRESHCYLKAHKARGNWREVVSWLCHARILHRKVLESSRCECRKESLLFLT